MKTPPKNISIEEKMQRAREQAAAQKEKERKKDEEYYISISSGPKWKISKIFSIYCVCLAALITAETLIDGKEQKLSLNDYQFYQGAINVEDDWYTPYYTDLTGFIDTSLRVIHSPLFGAPKYLQWTSKYEDSKTPLTFTEHTEWRYNSVYSYFIFIQIVLLLPIFFVWYKRPTPLFKFGRMLCLGLIFPASIFLLFVTFGIINLLPIGF